MKSMAWQATPTPVLDLLPSLLTTKTNRPPLAQRNIGGIQRLMLESIDFSEPDGELQRAAIQCSDPEATAWAWAAGEHLGFAPEDIIRDDEYDNSGAILRMQLGQRAYLGINGLSHAGFCAVRAGLYAEKRGLPAYPRMKHWLQRDFGHTGAAELRARLVPAA